MKPRIITAILLFLSSYAPLGLIVAIQNFDWAEESLGHKEISGAIACCTKREWPVTKTVGKLQITKDNCERVLRLMNDDLLESPVDQSLFNVDGAKQPTE
jgi:hypothetical protein